MNSNATSDIFWAYSSIRLERRAHNSVVLGSNPSRPTSAEYHTKLLHDASGEHHYKLFFARSKTMRGSYSTPTIGVCQNDLCCVSVQAHPCVPSGIEADQGLKPCCPTFDTVGKWSSGYDAAFTKQIPKVQILAYPYRNMNGWSSGMTQHYAYAGTDVQLIFRSLLHSEERNKYQSDVPLDGIRSLRVSSLVKQSCHNCFTLQKDNTTNTCWSTSTPVHSREAHNEGRKLATTRSYPNISPIPSSGHQGLITAGDTYPSRIPRRTSCSSLIEGGDYNHLPRLGA